MSKEKYIDEMAETICRRELDPNCSTCYFNMDCRDHLVAKKLYNAGYRKQSDVAREIFEEIEKHISSMEYRANTPRKTVKVEELKEQVDWVLHTVIPQALAELKKKYTEGET